MSESVFWWSLLAVSSLGVVYDIAQIMILRRQHREFMAAMRAANPRPPTQGTRHAR